MEPSAFYQIKHEELRFSFR